MWNQRWKTYDKSCHCKLRRVSLTWMTERVRERMCVCLFMCVCVCVFKKETIITAIYSLQTDHTIATSQTFTPITSFLSKASGQSPAITLDDLNVLRKDFQKSLDLQTVAILQTVNQQLQTLRNTIPSKLFLSNLVTIVKTEITQHEHALKSEFQTRLETLQEHIGDLISNLGQKLNRLQTTFSQTMTTISEDDYFQRTKAASTQSCVDKVIKAFGELSPGKPGSFEHYVRVTRLGVGESVSSLKSVVVVFDRWEDRMLVMMKGRKALNEHKLVMEMLPSYLRFTCAF